MHLIKKNNIFHENYSVKIRINLVMGMLYWASAVQLIETIP